MAFITLPTASPGSGGTGSGRKSGLRLPNAGAVPQIAPASDPGLVVPDLGAVPRAIEGLGGAVSEVGQRFAVVS